MLAAQVIVGATVQSSGPDGRGLVPAGRRGRPVAGFTLQTGAQRHCGLTGPALSDAVLTPARSPGSVVATSASAPDRPVSHRERGH